MNIKVGRAYVNFLAEQSRSITKHTHDDHYSTFRKISAMYPGLLISALNGDLIEDLDRRLQGMGLKPNTVWKHHKNFKVFIGWMIANGNLLRNPYVKKKIRQITGPKITVNEQEISTLEQAKLPANLSVFRDMFLVSYYTLLRRSDLMRITHAHFQGKKLTVTTQKTGKKVIIPVSERLRVIMERNNYKFPEDVDINSGIKKVFQKLGLNREVEILDYDNSNGFMEKVYRYVKLSDVVTIHSARRSGITAMVRSGIPTQSIMLLSGHSTEAALMAYIGISQDENADLLMNNKFFN